MTRDNRFFSTFTTVKKSGEVSHYKVAAGFGGLVTPVAVRLQDRRDLLMETDLFCGVRLVCKCKRRDKQKRKRGKQAMRFHGGKHSIAMDLKLPENRR